VRLSGLNVLLLAGLTAVAGTSTACGDFIRQDRSPVTLVVERLEASSGASGTSSTFTGTLQSDVVTNGSIFNDAGRVTMRLIMKDVGTTPTAVNAVTINRYLVTFRRADGRNTPGVDVPYPFDSATTFTVQPGSPAIQTFELVRHAAKEEAPLLALGLNVAVTIATVADVTFYGRDQAGNELSAQSSIGVIFGDFADPN
jgi:hypothetical protein